MTTKEITEISDIKSLFEKLDDYLIADIKTMQSIESMSSGGVGYPCLQTIISGMELLGILISQEREGKPFKAFWKELSETNKEYESFELQEVFYKVIRNGTAHFFLTKAGIYVSLHNPELHLNITKNNHLFISCEKLFEDFLITYERIKSFLLSNPESANIKRFAEKISDKGDYVNKYINSLKSKRFIPGKFDFPKSTKFISASGDDFAIGCKDENGNIHKVIPSA